LTVRHGTKVARVGAAVVTEIVGVLAVHGTRAGPTAHNLHNTLIIGRRGRIAFARGVNFRRVGQNVKPLVREGAGFRFGALQYFIETAAKAGIVQCHRVVVNGNIGQKQAIAVAVIGATRVAFGSGKDVAAVECERFRGVAVVAADAGDGIVHVTDSSLVRQTISRRGGVRGAGDQVFDFVSTFRGKFALEGVAVLGKDAVLEATVALPLLAVVHIATSSSTSRSKPKRCDIFTSVGVAAVACENNH